MSKKDRTMSTDRSTGETMPQLRREPSVELLRIFACIAVIGGHVWMGPCDYGTRFSSVFIRTLVYDSVGMFWFLTGFFMFRNYSWRRTMKRTLTGVFIPLMAFTLSVLFLFADLIDGTFTFAGIFQKGDELVSFVKYLVAWQNPLDYCTHLWFLYVYILVMIASPVLYAFARWMEEDPHRELAFLAITLIAFAWNDYTGNGNWNFSNYRLEGAVPASVAILWGHILYRHRDRFISRKRIPLYIAAFLCVNLIRTGIHLMRINGGSTNDNLLFWYTSFGLICASLAVMSALSMIKGRAATKGNRLICFLASHTFNIYLVHGVLINALENINLRVGTYKAVRDLLGSNGMLTGILYMLIMVPLVAAISLAISVAMRWSWRLVRRAAAAVSGRKTGAAGAD